MTTAMYVTQVVVLDGDAEVHLEVYKEAGGGMFAIDSSYLEQVLDEDELWVVPSVFGNGMVTLLDQDFTNEK